MSVSFIADMDNADECEWDDEDSRDSSFIPQPMRGGHSSGLNGEMMLLGGGPAGMAVMMNGGGRESVGSSQYEPSYNNIDSALPSDSDHGYDHHSSEEELEVINNSSYEDIIDEGDDEVTGSTCDELLLSSSPGGDHLLGHHNCEQNKRKWSQMANNRLSVESTASSSDEEVQGLLRPLSTPVEFCNSPPVDVHKPSRSQSPPPKLFLFSATNEPGGAIVSNDGVHSSSSLMMITPSSVPGALINCLSSSGGVFRGVAKSTANHTLVPSSSLNLNSAGQGFNPLANPNTTRPNDLNSMTKSPTSLVAAPVAQVPLLSSLSSCVSLSGGFANNNSSLINNHHHHQLYSSGAQGITASIPSSLSSGSGFVAITSTTKGWDRGNNPVIGNNNNNNINNGGGSNGRINGPVAPLRSSRASPSSLNLGISSGRNSSRSGRDAGVRKRHRHNHHHPRHIQRPWLDFEKMQQVSTHFFSRLLY